MSEKLLKIIIFSICASLATANDVMGCGGFLKSHVQIDFSKVIIKLFTKQGILKDQTNCAPNSGYYFIPIYDKGDYILKLEPPPGWSFDPTTVNLSIDRKNDICSKGKDINFIFKGFGITGKVESEGSKDGPAGIEVKLESESEVRTVQTGENGAFFFTPVYPGTYRVTVLHPKWKFIKQSLEVTVTEGNTDLPDKSLVIVGYNVKGVVKSDKDPVKGAVIMLHGDKKSLKYIENCDSSTLSSVKPANNYLCHVISNDQGEYEILSVPNGDYYVTPFYKGRNIYFKPTAIEFTVNHDTVQIAEAFEIVGFNVKGLVLAYEHGPPLSDAVIYLNGEKTTTTDSRGIYTLERIKAGAYTLTVKMDNYQFEQKILRINPNLSELPSIFPLAYIVCGVVVSENSQTVTISKVGSTQHTTVKTKAPTGKFCEHLRPGNYNLQVMVNDHDKSRGIQFFPVIQTISVVNKPVLDVTFSQLKATILGKIQPLPNENIAKLNVILRPIVHDVALVNKDLLTHTAGGSYTFKDIRPGMYEVLLPTNPFCWKEDKHLITVSSSLLTVPSFIQSGYLVIFHSTHDTKISYKHANQTWKTVDIQRGKTTYCVDEGRKYEFKLESCHVYESNIVFYDTSNESNEVHLTALKHKNSIYIKANRNLGNISMTVNLGGTKTLVGPLLYKEKRYKLVLYLGPKESVILVPQSEIVYFNPPIIQVEGGDDCTDMGEIFEAVKGRVFQGKVTPPLEGVQISIISDNSDTLMDETDAEGNYKFPPLDDTKNYLISASMDSYILVGPDDNGNFLAHKLAEITVEVIDESDNKYLQGALLSLSGAQSYRSNLQTSSDGIITFQSLSPGEYFLKPMMKEYSFEPSSKIIKIDEGANVNVLLKGRRIAYSAFGYVTSLNGEPEERIIVAAVGIKNCSQYSEESTTESNGEFRIRGLLPYCSYSIQVKGSLDELDHYERAAPSSISIENVSHDISNLKLIIFRPVRNTDILLRVYTANPDHYKSLKIKLLRESPPAAYVHTLRIDSSTFKLTKDNNAGVMIHFPSIPTDNKMYSIHIESSLPQFNKLKRPVEYFYANTSFKFVKLNCFIKSGASDQQIKQTSIWTLMFIFCVMISMYNIERLLFIFKRSLSKIEVDKLIQMKGKIPEKEFTTDNEIDQIVQNINATKKKVKPKKI